MFKFIFCSLFVSIISTGYAASIDQPGKDQSKFTPLPLHPRDYELVCKTDKKFGLNHKENYYPEPSFDQKSEWALSRKTQVEVEVVPPVVLPLDKNAQNMERFLFLPFAE